MKKATPNNIIIILICLLFSIDVSSQNAISWEQQFSDEFGQTVQHINTLDSGVLLLTTSRDSITDINYYAILKCDLTGNIEWTFRYENQNAYFGNIAESPDSSFVIAFTGDSNPAAQNKIHVLKLDKNGNLVYGNYYSLPTPYTTDGSIPGVMARNNGGYYIASYISDANASSVLHVMSLDSNGNAQWSRTYDTTNTHSDYTCLDTCANGDLMIATSAEVGAGTEVSLDVARLSPNGNLLWFKHYTIPNRHLHLRKMLTAGVDSFYLVAMTHVPFTTGPEASVTLMNGNGYVMWSHNHSFPLMSDVRDAAVDEDGNLAFISVVDDTLPFSSSCITLLNTGGVELYSQHTYALQYQCVDYRSNGQFSVGGRGGEANFFPFYMLLDTTLQGCDGASTFVNVTALSFAYSTGSGYANVPLATGSDSVNHVAKNCQTIVHCPLVGIDEPVIHNAVRVYPVPSSDRVTIESEWPPESIEVFDNNGNLIYATLQCASKNEIEIAAWNPGLYFIRVSGANSCVTTKIIVE